MKKVISIFLIIFSFLFSWQIASYAQTNTAPEKDSKELMIQDTLLLLLHEEIDSAVTDFYSDSLSESPTVYPYQIEIVEVKRVGGFRGFHFLITLEATPVVGPHISVGKDRMTLEVDPTIDGNVRLKKFEHLETHDLPPHWQHIIKKENNG